jgi:hypothetical protein
MSRRLTGGVSPPQKGWSISGSFPVFVSIAFAIAVITLCLAGLMVTWGNRASAGFSAANPRFVFVLVFELILLALIIPAVIGNKAATITSGGGSALSGSVVAAPIPYVLANSFRFSLFLLAIPLPFIVVIYMLGGLDWDQIMIAFLTDVLTVAIVGSMTSAALTLLRYQGRSLVLAHVCAFSLLFGPIVVGMLVPRHQSSAGAASIVSYLSPITVVLATIRGTSEPFPWYGPPSGFTPSCPTSPPPYGVPERPCLAGQASRVRLVSMFGLLGILSLEAAVAVGIDRALRRYPPSASKRHRRPSQEDGIGI